MRNGRYLPGGRSCTEEDDEIEPKDEPKSAERIDSNLIFECAD